MSTLFIQAQGNPVQAFGRWQPELVYTPLDDNGDPLPQVVAMGLYTGNFYVSKRLHTFLRRRPDPPADPDDPPAPIPPGHLLEDVYMITAYTDAGRAILDPIHAELYRRCLRRMQWRTWSFEPGLRAVPVHTHQMNGEELDERIAWQLVGEDIDTVPPKTRADVRNRQRERNGVQVTYTADDKIRIRRRGGGTVIYADVTAGPT